LGLGLLFLAGLIVSQGVALADTVSMTLTAPPSGPSEYGIYVDPYYATINNTPSVAVICDDFLADTYQADSWWATTYNYNGSPTSLANTRMAATETNPNLTLTQAYDEVAWLSVQLLSNMSDADRVSISFALWSVFQPTAVENWLEGYHTTLDAVAGHWLTDAQNNIAAGDAYLRNDITIYSPGPVISCPYGCPNTPTQEFLVVRTPEVSTLAILVLDLLGVLSAVFLFRRRTVRIAGLPK